MPAAGEGATCPLRVRLAFDDVGLSEAFLAQGKHRCWYLLPSAVKTVKQLADRLVQDFGLATSSGQGLILQVEGYTLLHTLAIGVVRDGDTIIKKKKRKHANAEEVPQNAEVVMGDPTSKNKKKHKKSKQLVDAETADAAELPRSKKRKHKSDHDVIEKHVSAPSHEEPAENGRARKAVSAKKVAKVKDVQEPLLSVPERFDSDHNVSPASERLDGLQSEDDAHPGSDSQHPSKTGPSRSARRKAFKRRRKREEKAAVEAVELPAVSRPTQENAQPLTPVQPAQQVHTGQTPRTQHMPGAQDVSGSRIFKKGQGGHVRFQSDSEEEDQAALAAVHDAVEPEVAPSAAATAVDAAPPISVDGMPLLATQPQDGDAIVFKYLELTSAWNPELSDFKEATVLQYDASTNQVSLRLRIEYDGQNSRENEVEDAYQTQPSVSGLLSVEEDGSWKMDYGSLLEVHLKHGTSEGRSPMPTPLATSCPTFTTAPGGEASQATTQDTAVVPLSQTAPTAAAPAASAAVSEPIATTMQAKAPLTVSSATTRSEQLSLTADPWKHFEMLASQLQQRRMELAAKSGSSSSDVVGQQPHTTATQVSTTTVTQGDGTQQAQAPLPAAAGIGRSAVRQSGMRAGAVGPLLTMLRAQQELS
eukprot:jgi/Chlat1/6475/Chrsp45S05970